MKTNFCDILPHILDREGLYGNDPDDRGGETYKGIARNFHPDWEGWEIVDRYKHNNHPDFPNVLEQDKRLQREVADFYEKEFWGPSRAEQLPGYLRDIYFDMCINHGQSRAVKILQQAITREGHDITIDGKIGPETIGHAPYVELKDVAYERIYFYSIIIQNDPGQMKFRKGWYNRTLEFIGE